MHYPVIIEQDENTYAVRFPDIPEALTCADTPEEALTAAQDALITAFEFYFEDQRKVPLPSPDAGRQTVTVPASVWAKVLLLNTMLDQGVTQVELARRMGTRKQDIQRIVDLDHNTKIDTLSHALAAMGKRLEVHLA